MIVVNPATRQFNIPGADLVFGVTADANSAIKHFQCPRYVGNNVDIASSFVRINYQNAHGDIDFYLVKDVTVDGDNVTFSWELHPKVTMYKGNVSFVMCVTGPDTKVKWHTTMGRGQVLEGLEPDNALVETETSDGIAALIAMVEAQTEAVADKGAEWVRNVQSEGTDQIIAVQTAGAESRAAAVAEIEAKGKNVMESIPDDYTSLGNAVDSLVRGRAGAIVCEVEGFAVAAKDASNMAIQGLRIFGRSTQDGIPTPDAPVEIVSVESPVVTVAGKNLLNTDIFKSSSAVGGFKADYEGDGIIHIYGTSTQTDPTAHVVTELAIPIDPSKNYTLHTEFLDGKINGIINLHTYMAVGEEPGKRTNWLAVKLDSTSAVGEVRHTVGKPSDYNAEAKFLTRFWVYVRFPAIGDTMDIRIRVWLTATDDPTTYEPYKPVQTVETTHPLRGIPVTTGGNYTDGNGQQWICDEVDLERGVLVKRVNAFVIDGSFTGSISRETEKEKTQVFLVVLPKSHPEKYRRDFFSNRFVSYVATDDAEKMVPNLNSVYVALNKERLTELSVTGFRAWATNNPITMHYVQETPEEIPLSETEIAAYRAMHTYKPNTTIVNNSGAHMKVEYAADTKLYIDNKLVALVGNT